MNIFFRAFLIIIFFCSHAFADNHIAESEQKTDINTDSKPDFAEPRSAHDYTSLGFSELLILNNLRAFGKSVTRSMRSDADELFSQGRAFVVSGDQLTFEDFKEKLLKIEENSKALWGFESFESDPKIGEISQEISSLSALVENRTVLDFSRDSCPPSQSCQENIQNLGESLVRLTLSTSTVAKNFERNGEITKSIISFPTTHKLPELLTVASQLSLEQDFKPLLFPYLIGKSEFFRAETRLIDYIGAQDADLANQLRAILAVQNPSRVELSSLLKKAAEVL